MPSTLPLETALALSRGAVLLTPNKRATRTLTAHFDSLQREAGKVAWEPPQIMPWAAWISSLWNDLLLRGETNLIPLSALQEQIIWRRLIDGDRRVQAATSAVSLAKLAKGASDLLSQWDIHDSARRYLSTANRDSIIFNDWLGSFQRSCKASGYISTAMLDLALAKALRKRITLSLPGEIFLIGFDQFTPAQKELQIALSERGARIVSQPVPILQISEPVCTLVRCDNPAEETFAAAEWARNQLEQFPSSSIALIVPRLEEHKEDIGRILRQEFASLGAGTLSESIPVAEFSLGDPLSNLSMVRDALRILHLAVEPLDFEEISLLIRSPWLGNEQEVQARSEFDAFHLRELSLLRPELSLGQLIRILQTRIEAPLVSLRENLLALRELSREQTSGKRSFIEWMEIVHALLSAVGWPDSRALQSQEFQILERWNELLDQIVTLDFEGDRISYAEMLALLQEQAAATLFAPMSQETPIQVMDPVEAAGSTFDAIWCLHGSSEEWLPGRSTHPLLPWALQHDLGMPGAVPDTDEALSSTATSRIKLSAPHVLFSYAHRDSNGERRPSTAIERLPNLRHEASTTTKSRAPKVSALVESVDDLPLPPLPYQSAPGGVSILQAHSACAFKSFSEKRLFSTPLKELESGFTPLERGDHVHKVLELFWNKVGSQDELRVQSLRLSGNRADETERDALLRSCIDQVIPKLGFSSWEDAYTSLHKRRMYDLLTVWLDSELERPPFTVEGSERLLKDIPIGPLRLNLRIDRIDRVEVMDEWGELLPASMLIDYKTGECSVSAWSGPRPDLPQLPLYAVASGIEDVQAVAFASVRAGDKGSRFYGISSDPSLISKRRSSFDPSSFTGEVERWKETLTSLAEDFASGNTAASPKSYPTTCKQCGQRILCRLIPPISVESADASEEGLDDE